MPNKFYKTLRDEPKKLFDKYSIGGASASLGLDLGTQHNMTATAGSGIHSTGPDANGTPQDKLIRYTRLRKAARISYIQTVEQFLPGRGVSLGMTANLAHPGGAWNANSEWVPAYFLPWDGRGAIVGLAIPALAVNLPLDQYPRLFVTAALSGCSIQVIGAPDSPTIRHCGSENTVNAADATTFWNDALHHFGLDVSNAVGTRLGIAHNKDYARPNRGGMGHGDTHATSFEQQLQQKYKGSANHRGIEIMTVMPWGTVFGIRDQGLQTWKFYLQENATIQYKRWTGVLNKTAGAQQVVSRPMTIRQIFPQAAGGSSVNLKTFRQLKNLQSA